MGKRAVQFSVGNETKQKEWWEATTTGFRENQGEHVCGWVAQGSCGKTRCFWLGDGAA